MHYRLSVSTQVSGVGELPTLLSIQNLNLFAIHKVKSNQTLRSNKSPRIFLSLHYDHFLPKRENSEGMHNHNEPLSHPPAIFTFDDRHMKKNATHKPSFRSVRPMAIDTSLQQSIDVTCPSAPRNILGQASLFFPSPRSVIHHQTSASSSGFFEEEEETTSIATSTATISPMSQL